MYSEIRLLRHALAVDHLVLLLVEGGRVILEELDERARLRVLRKGSWPCLRKCGGVES
jgi:hypothetical protein